MIHYEKGDICKVLSTGKEVSVDWISRHDGYKPILARIPGSTMGKWYSLDELEFVRRPERWE